MKFSEIELPTNRRFGFFFTFIFAVAAVYFISTSNIIWAYSFIAATLIFLAITLVKDNLLLPLNKLWMRFGLLIGMIISPIVLGIIFFGLITPVAVLTRLFGRDELRLRLMDKSSHWISRTDPINPQLFKRQF